MNDLFSLRDAVAVIAGGGSGFGPDLAAGLANAGAAVAVADLDADAAERAAQTARQSGRPAFAAALDATDKAATLQFVEAVNAALGAPTVLVNLIAAPVRKGPSETYDDEVFLSMYNTNVRSYLLMCQAVWPSMQKAQRGSIVNFASTAGIAGQQHQVGYAATKGAVVQLTRTLALDWAPHIRVNAVAPTIFDTEGFRRVVKGDPERGMPAMPPDYLDRARSRIPLGRIGSPNEIVGPVIFLASQASSMVTGHILVVDGGMLVGPYSGPGRA